MEVITLVMWIAFSLLCMYLAEQRGRDKTLGFLAGLLFGVFAIIYYLCAGDSQELRDEKMVERENRLDTLRGKK